MEAFYMVKFTYIKPVTWLEVGTFLFHDGKGFFRLVLLKKKFSFIQLGIGHCSNKHLGQWKGALKKSL